MEEQKHIQHEQASKVSDVVLAEQYRNEARELLAETRQAMSKIQRFNDLSMSNQRQLILAMSNLLPRPIVADFDVNFEDESEAMEDFAQDMVTTLKQREIFDVIHAINVLALSNTDVIQVFTDIDGNSPSFSVWVVDISTDWSNRESNKDRLLDETVYFRIGPKPLEKLLFIESQLTELIIEAREQAEAKAEVNHG
ncbi:hypothetical protein SKP08_002703 [Vibrio fluvialis]|uniref:hypothetical protein n=1 Tax=Vibrio fluvialis TaxID=676 RepID=UPI0013021F23|nr:hypothetical protein [Vibrio fluvialis]EKO3514165.1 hypothetical protein [Vibrio fluvialis]ELX7502623.1 hypothetical protein [Vibrio fluvialis]